MIRAGITTDKIQSNYKIHSDRFIKKWLIFLKKLIALRRLKLSEYCLNSSL